jgi:hypothetical protein
MPLKVISTKIKKKPRGFLIMIMSELYPDSGEAKNS